MVANSISLQNADKLPSFLYGTAWKEERTQQLVESALRAGFRGIDTANQRRHYFEKAVGDGLVAAYGAGVVNRAEVFLQTKFTYRRGHDHRLPYDPDVNLATQVAQSIASSLEHLQTHYVDSYVLHGPASHEGWTRDDRQVWAAMANACAAGQTRLLGVSNVDIQQLKVMMRAGAVPSFVQNRCYAAQGWDRKVRIFCGEHNIVYQGFSLLTANPQVLRHPLIADIARSRKITPAQVVFSFARAVAILPLTGTSKPEHMKEDLASSEITLSDLEVLMIEAIASSAQRTL